MSQFDAIIAEVLARRRALGQECEVADVSSPGAEELPGGIVILTVRVAIRPVQDGGRFAPGTARKG